ncbi:hypothetical protein BCR44DRAFT_1440407 [Catenaria anguillulae PL171]|uniref:Uncharacterized protein n=1 Tax=Catenaria anguillulae PL171 TaxID=765915 RepID=A0A1Y2HCS9_9FUNG|nr:hypothetical protein BCR44DRAFT_1440407 [Catenaria anguillulae PL171]
MGWASPYQPPISPVLGSPNSPTHSATPSNDSDEDDDDDDSSLGASSHGFAAGASTYNTSYYNLHNSYSGGSWQYSPSSHSSVSSRNHFSSRECPDCPKPQSYWYSCSPSYYSTHSPGGSPGRSLAQEPLDHLGYGPTQPSDSPFDPQSGGAAAPASSPTPDSTTSSPRCSATEPKTQSQADPPTWAHHPECIHFPDRDPFATRPSNTYYSPCSPSYTPTSPFSSSYVGYSPTSSGCNPTSNYSSASPGYNPAGGSPGFNPAGGSPGYNTTSTWQPMDGRAGHLRRRFT